MLQNSSEQGIVTDGTYLYTSSWNSDLFRKYDMTGNFIESFTIPGITNIRDLTYDGTYFYGGNTNAEIYQMNFANRTLVSTIPVTVVVRHCTYDPINDGFWIGDWDSLILVNRSGETLDTSTLSLSSLYGTAYDCVSVDSPSLWLFHQGSGSQSILSRYDIATDSIVTAETYDLNINESIPDGIAGGAYGAKVGGNYLLFANVQKAPNEIHIYHLEPSSNAKLSDLTFSADGGSETAITDFDEDTLTYNVTLPCSTADDASITLTPTTVNPYAQITANAGTTLSNGTGTATVTVTAIDGVTQQIYTVNFSVNHTHTWDAGVVTTPPTYSAAGVLTYTCTVCHTTKTEAIAKLEYIDKTLTNAATGITASGNYTAEAALQVTPISSGADYNALFSLVSGGQTVLGAYDISITDDGYSGAITLSFPVNSAYNGKTITIRHKLAGGDIETYQVVCANGFATVTVNELSPFMMSAASLSPKTDDSAPYLPLYIAGMLLSGALLTIGFKKYKGKKNT